MERVGQKSRGEGTSSSTDRWFSVLRQKNLAAHCAPGFFKFLCNLTFKGHFFFLEKGNKSTETGLKTETEPRTHLIRNRLSEEMWS